MVTGAGGTRRGRQAGITLLAALAALTPVGANGRAQAAEAGQPPALWQPQAAAAFLLAEVPRPPEPAPAEDWNGSLPDAVVRGLFGTYRTVFSSQDVAVCAFSPSCSRFSERAIDRCGFFTGALLTLDRLLRDHPLAVGLYPPIPGGHLLLDDVERYCPAAPAAASARAPGR